MRLRPKAAASSARGVTVAALWQEGCKAVALEGVPPAYYCEGMVFVSLTRLRVRSIRFLPMFALDALRTQRQVQRAPGFKVGALLPDRRWTFWTMTAWDSQESMRRYMTTGAHKTAMPKLLHWCDEASVAHWEQESEALPGWEEADRRMRESGRVSKVRFPSPQHAELRYAIPRTSRSAPIAKV